ncbi:hypothetical protein LNV83_21220, partial [Klebsiella quasipneumoniae]|uniref:hypothetical protein n=1 Tax=Klebsiella quasipneumoniae TaxID=1463165 RepID=UPI001FCAF0F9
KRAYCLKTQPATGETYPKSDLFNKASYSVKMTLVRSQYVYVHDDHFDYIRWHEPESMETHRVTHHDP